MFPGREVLPPEVIPLPVPAALPFRRVDRFLARSKRKRPMEVLVKWSDLPDASWVEAEHMRHECVRAYGDDKVFKQLLAAIP